MKIKKIFSAKLVNIHFVLAILAATSVSAQGQTHEWSLQQCVDTALVHNKNLQISRNNIALTEEKKKTAKAQFLPKLNASADYKYFIELPYQLMPMSVFGGQEGQFKETQFGVPHNIGLNVQAALPLYNSQITGAVQSADVASEVNKLRFEKTAEQIIVEVTNLYYNAQILRHQLSFIDSNLVNSKKLLNNMRALYEQKMATGTDIKKAELQVERLITQRQLATSQLEQILNALKFTMGIPIQERVTVEAKILHETNFEYQERSSVDQELADAGTKLLISELKTLRNSGLPTASLYGSYGAMGYGYDEKPNDFLNFYPSGFVGVRIDVPLFNGTVNRRKIAQKKIEIQNSELQSELTSGQNRMSIQNAERQRSAMRQTIEDAEGQIGLAEAVYEQTVLQQREGTAALNDVILAENALHEAQQSYLSAVVDYLKADLDLKKVTGNISSHN